MLDISDFCNNRKNKSLSSYENLTSSLESKSISNAEKTLASGWILGNNRPVFLDEEIPWDESEKTNRSWSFHIHCWDMIHDLLMAYSMTPKRRYFDSSLRVALEWAVRYSSFDTSSTFAWYDMAVGLRVQRLAYILDVAIRMDDIDSKDISILFECLELHRIYLEDDKNIKYHNNHGFYQAAGQLAMARRFDTLPNMKEALIQAKERLVKLLDSQFSEEYIHMEHSPDYHRMVYDTLLGIIKSGLIQDNDIISKAKEIEKNLAWFVLPNGNLANFGDSDYRMIQTEKITTNKWETEVMQYVSSGGTKGVPPEENVRVFEKTGYFVVRKPWSPLNGIKHGSYLAQTLAFHSRTHKHADDLSLIWYDRGKEILVDSGRYGYLQKVETGSDLWKQGFWYKDPNRVYVESTHAHNTVEIDGKCNPRKGVVPYGSALQRWGSQNGLYFCEGHVRIFKSIRFYRTLVFLPDQWLLVFDWLWDNEKKPHNFRQWFHFAPGLESFQNQDHLVIPISNSKPLHVASLLKEPQLSEVFRGQTEPRIQGWFSPKEREMIPNDTVAFEVFDKQSAVFATLLAFCDDLNVNTEWSMVSKSGRQARFRWTTDSLNHELIIERPEKGDIRINYKEESSI